MMAVWDKKPMAPHMNWRCGHSPTAEDPPCGDDATWHGFRLTDDGVGIAWMTACCDVHEAPMALNADFVHPLAHPCAIPGSRFRWPENFCFTDWDEQTEFAFAETPFHAAR